MTEPVRVLSFAGSLRAGSFNKQVARLAAEAARAAGAEAAFVDLREYPLPLYDGDLEESSGLPEPARQLKQLFVAHEALIFACPEYNSTIPGVMKNAIDWISRAETDDEPPLAALDGKVAALFSASPGALGGLRSLATVRTMLGNLGVFVLPEQLAIPRAHEALDDHGQLKDARRRAALEGIVRGLVDVAGRLRGM